MAIDRYRHDKALRTHGPDQPRDPRVYTPTMNGFERFVRQSVGLRPGRPSQDQDIDVKPQQGRTRQ